MPDTFLIIDLNLVIPTTLGTLVNDSLSVANNLELLTSRSFAEPLTYRCPNFAHSRASSLILTSNHPESVSLQGFHTY